MDFTEVASTVRKRRMGGGGCGTVSCLSSVCRAEAFTELAAFSTRDARCTLARVGTEAESRAGEMDGLGRSFRLVPLRFRLAQPGRKRPKTSRAMRFTDRRFSSSSRDMSERM